MVGFHGQTVMHQPQTKLTVQIGDGAALARRLGIPVVHDFRPPTSRPAGRARRWCRCSIARSCTRIDRPHPVAVLNIGGVANVTFVDGGPDPIACDTGPGNALIDDFMRARTGAPYDDNGDAAAGGKPDWAFIARVLEHPFFDLKPPKSLDRNAFAFANIGLPEFSVAGRRRDAVGADRRGGGARRAAPAGAAARLDRRRRRRAQPHADDDAGRAARAGDGRDRGSRPAGRRMRSRRRRSRSSRCARMRGLPITFPTTSGAPRPMPGGVVARP